MPRTWKSAWEWEGTPVDWPVEGLPPITRTIATESQEEMKTKRTLKTKTGLSRETPECSSEDPVPDQVIREIAGGNEIKTLPDELKLPEPE